MTRVCLLGKEDVSIRADIFSYETARAALATYDLHQPFENSLAVDTMSLGAAVSLLNDLNWYLVRLVDQALVRDPSISRTEWLSRDLASQVRDGEKAPEETAEYLAVHGLDEGKLVEPMYVTRVDGEIPEYDLRDLEETVVVRVTADEFPA